MLGIGGLVLIVFLYGRTLRKLSPASRNVLTVLRAALLLVLCLLLAGPSRVRRPAGDDQKNERHLAVIVTMAAGESAIAACSAAQSWVSAPGVPGLVASSRLAAFSSLLANR